MFINALLSTKMHKYVCVSVYNSKKIINFVEDVYNWCSYEQQNKNYTQLQKISNFLKLSSLITENKVYAHIHSI